MTRWPNATSRLARLGDLTYRRRGRVLLAWIAALVDVEPPRAAAEGKR